MRLPWPVAALVALSSCWIRDARYADEERARMDRLVGTKVAPIVHEWGPPGRTFENGDTTIYEWVWGRCKTWLDTDDQGVITAWNYDGRCGDLPRQ